MKLKFTLLLLLAFCIGTAINAQDPVEKIIEPDVGFLDDLIVGDTAEDGSQLSDIYVLRRDAKYLVQGQFSNYDWKLHMKAEEGTGLRPYVQSFPQEDGTIYSHLIRNYGDVELENIYFDCQGDDPAMRPGGRVIRSEFEGAKIDVRGCVFANCGQNGVMLPKATGHCIMDDMLFVNMGRFGFYDYGNGRVFDCRDAEIDEFTLTNSTFVNNVDRIIRHRGGSGVMNKTKLDHCTVINSMCYHGFIELGNIGESVQLTNLLMVDCMGMGSDSTDVTRLSELDAHGENDAAGNPRMVWIGSIPNDSTMWTINNNVYTNTAAQQAWFDATPDTNKVDEGPMWILTEHIKGKLGDGAATAWIKKDFTLPNIPNPPTDFYDFYWMRGKQKETTTEVDYDTRSTEYWLDTLDCQLLLNDADFMGSDGVAVGDPNWESSANVGVAKYNASGIEMNAYPNPFSDQATVRFTLDRSSSVSYEIYDITGKSVRNMKVGNFAAGENSVMIQRENLRTGMYILKLNTGNQSGIMRISVY